MRRIPIHDLVMKKALIAIAVLVPVVFLGFFLVGGTILSKVATAGMQAFIPQVTGTPVSVGGLRLSPLTGSGTVSGFVLGNPEGFQSDHSIAFDEAHLDVAALSILGERILIEKVHVRAPRFNYERKLLSSNIREILKNVQAASGRVPEDGKPAPEDTGPDADSRIRIEIRELVIEEGQVSISAAGASVPLPLPRIVLRDLGTDKGGIPPEEMVFEVMSVVLRQVLESATKAPGTTVDGIRNLFGGGKD
jgi:hypothetical protein